jgi:hypothetical protein
MKDSTILKSGFDFVVSTVPFEGISHFTPSMMDISEAVNRAHGVRFFLFSINAM